MGGPGNRRRKEWKKMEGIAKAMRENYPKRNPKQAKHVDHLKLKNKT